MQSVRDGLGGGFDDAYRNAMDRRAASPDVAHLSDDAALSLHAYTRTEIAYTANEAFRVGPDDPHFAEANHQVSAIEGGLNELPKLEGTDLVRGINFIGNADKIKLTADEYKPGQVAVEPALVSASITRDGLEGSKFGSDVVIHIKSQTFRDISGISDKPGEREGLGKVGTQLYVHSNEEVRLPNGRTQRVIHAEEIVPGDPRYLDPESAQSAMDARRQRFADAKAAEDALPKTKSSIWEALNGSSEPKPEPTPADHVPAEPGAAAQHTPLDDTATSPPTEPHEPAGQQPAGPDQSAAQQPADQHQPGQTAEHQPEQTVEDQAAADRRSRIEQAFGPAEEPKSPETQAAEQAAAAARRSRIEQVFGPIDDPAETTPSVEQPGRSNISDILGGNHYGESPRLSEPEPAAGRTPADTRPGTEPTSGPQRTGTEPIPGSERAGTGQTPADTRPGTEPSLGTQRPGSESTPGSQRTGTEPGASRTGTPAEQHPAARTPEHQVTARTTDRPSTDRPGTERPGAEHAYSGDDPAQQHPTAEQHEPGQHPENQHTQNQHTEGQHSDQAEHPTEHPAEQPEPEPDFSSMAQSSPLHSEPAIDASTAPRELQDKYVAAKHAELPNTNPHFKDPDAYQKGYQTNCTRCVVSYAKRLLGIDDHPDPVLPKDLPTKGTLEYVQQNLGGTWEGHGSYDDVINRMRQEPVGSHAVIGVLSPDGHGGFTGHVAMVAHTEDGIVFIDPQDGRLLNLPHPAAKIDLLPFGSLAKPEELPAAGHETAGHETPGHETPGQETPAQQPSAVGPDGLPKPALTHELPTKPEEATQHEPQQAPQHEPQQGHGAPAEQHAYGTSDDHPDVQHFLDQPHVQEALQHSADSGQTIKVGDDELPVADVIRERLPQHPELVQMMNDNGYLEHSLLARPKTIASLLVHEDAIPMLHDAVHTVHDRGPEAVLADHLGDPQPTPLTPEQHEVSGHVEQDVIAQPHSALQPDFDQSRTQDPPYVEEYLHQQYEHAAVAQTELNGVVDSVAGQTDGIPGYRPGPKDWARAMDKVNGYKGDASKLVDLAGAKIQFRTVADAYRALERIREDPRLTIVKFEDRFENPQDSGYRDLQMSVRMSNGHIAELRLHLLSIDDVAKYEHAIYEVRRDLKAVAKDESREMSPYEQALRNTLLMRTQELFQAALESGLS